MNAKLEIVDTQGRLPVKRKFSMSSTLWTVGSGLHNHLILLDREIPERAGKISFRSNSEVLWEPLSGASENLLEKTAKIGSYQIRAVVKKPIQKEIKLALLLIPLLFVLTGSKRFKNLLHFKHPSKSARLLELPAQGEYGSFRPDESNPVVEFEFKAKKGSALELRYAAGNISQVDQLLIEVNGKYVGFSSPTPNRWGVEEFKIIRGQLLKNGKNTLKFSNQYPSLNHGIWGVRNMYVKEAGKNAESQIDTPAALFEKAEQFYDQRVSQVGNLWRAEQNVQKAIATWISEEGSAPEKATELKNKIDLATSNLISEKMSQARAELSVGNRGSAQNTVRELLAEFVDPQDPRKEKIEKLWWEMNR